MASPTKRIQWAQFDAFIEHDGKAPHNMLHDEKPISIDDIQNFGALANDDDVADTPQGLCRCLVFATGGGVGGIHLAPKLDHACDELQVDDFFPNGAFSIKVLELPGTGIKLPSDWRIIVSSGRGNSPLNEAISDCFGCKWYGNIILANYSVAGQRRRKMNNIAWSLRPYAGVILSMFLYTYGEREKILSV